MPSWSSEIIISASDSSMPRLSTPRILPTSSTMFLPGMKVPGAENTPFMPARALGAPHTTWIGFSPLATWPISTMQTLRRSAFGCFSAEMTEAMTKGASCAALSSTFSTSRPIMVSLSTISASEASVSRCSLSQGRVNFMIGGWSAAAPSLTLPRTRGREQAVPFALPCPSQRTQRRHPLNPPASVGKSSGRKP